MKRLIAYAALGLVVMVSHATTDDAPAVFWPELAGCQPHDSRTPGSIQDAVLRGKDIACIMGQILIDDPVELAKACEIADQLEKVVPIIRGLVGVRNGARRSGVAFQLDRSDAGPDAP